MSISKNAIKNVKADLKREGKIKTWSVGYGQDKKYYTSLIVPKRAKNSGK